MNKFKKAPLMALVIGLGFIAIVGLSSFVKVSFNPRLESKTYYHVGNLFVATPPNIPEYSCQPDDYSCTIVFEGLSVPSVDDFPEGTLPTGSWTATPQDINRSWKKSI